MTCTIAEWQKAAYELAVSKGFHSRECPESNCHRERCTTCLDQGCIPVDPFSPTRIASRLALIHCEISEAVECVVRGRTELYWICPAPYEHTRAELEATKARGQEGFLEAAASGFKPEGFPIELADVFLRRADFAESNKLPIDVHTERACAVSFLRDLVPTNPEHVVNALCGLHAMLHDPNGSGFVRFDALLFEIAEWTNVDLLAMAELKHEYNKTRPFMHGGKLL